MKTCKTQGAIASTLLMGLGCAGLRADPAMTADMSSSAGMCSSMDEISVTARRVELIGKASTASEAVVADEEIQLAPAYRPGQLLETVPGLIATLHSGEGKANQYRLRGYNLDHGTDLATYVDNIPVNQPTHAHGQGYTESWTHPLRQRDKWQLRSLQARISLERKESHDEELPPQPFCGI